MGILFDPGEKHWPARVRLRKHRYQKTQSRETLVDGIHDGNNSVGCFADGFEK